LHGDAAQRAQGMPTYGRLAYPDVYPGVKLTVETRRHALMYRFDVAPGADPGAIRMRYAGADGVAIEEKGKALRIHAGDKSLRETGLRCFQGSDDEVDVPCRYAFGPENDGIVIALGPYDRSRSLVIDPQIGWSSFLGASGIDYGRAIAVDNTGNLYVVGYTSSTDFPTTNGFDTRIDGFFDAYVTKLGPAGTSLTWSSYLGGTSDEYGYGVAVDSDGNVYVVGNTYSTDFPSAGGFDDTMDGWSDVFVAKVAASGASLEWSSYLGGTSGEEARGIAVDAGGNVYVTGNTSSSDFPVPAGFDTTFDGWSDAFVTKVDASGSSLVWSSFLGGTSGEYGYAIAVDGAGAAHVTGETSSTDFPLVSEFDDTRESSEVFVTKVDPSGSSLAWSTYLGGTSSDQGYALALDSSGNVYVTGYTSSSDFPAIGGFDTTQQGTDAFVTKIEPLGPSIVWSSFLGGTSSDYGYAIAVDSTGSPCVVGYTFSTDFPLEGAFDTSIGGGLDGFAAKVDASGAILEWSTYLGGRSSDYAYGVVVDPTDNVFATGYTYSTDFPAMNGFDTTVGSTPDGYVMNIVVCGNGTCDTGEDPCNCPDDCGADTCGNGCCGAAENACLCEEDCPDICGNNCCGSQETPCTCPADCGEDICGNACCGPEETACDCETDCPDICGDGCCTGGENSCGCPGDCGEEVCGNGFCCAIKGEDACDCEEDCSDRVLCGDGCCGSAEGCETCPDDCGACGELGPDGGTGGEGSDGCSCAVGNAPGGMPIALVFAWALWLLRRRD